jgi:hypothetical protein
MLLWSYDDTGYMTGANLEKIGDVAPDLFCRHLFANSLRNKRRLSVCRNLLDGKSHSIKLLA